MAKFLQEWNEFVGFMERGKGEDEKGEDTVCSSLTIDYQSECMEGVMEPMEWGDNRAIWKM